MPELTPTTWGPVTITLSPALNAEGFEITIVEAVYVDDPGFLALEPGVRVDAAELDKHTKSGVYVVIHKDGALTLYLLITQEAALKYAGELVKSVVIASPERVEECAEMVMNAAKEALEERAGRPDPPLLPPPGPGGVSVP